MWEVAAGSVVGYDHISVGKTLVGRNCQDAYAIRRYPAELVAVICDGCGSGAHSEFGARLGANVLSHLVACERSYSSAWPLTTEEFEKRLHLSRSDLLRVLQETAYQMTGMPISPSFVNDYLLFTIVGVHISDQAVYVFSIGDGCVGGSIQGVPWRTVFGKTENNTPPYVAYDLVPSAISSMIDTTFKLMRFDPDELDGLYIGSDGLVDWVQSKVLPGTDTPIGPINQFCEDDVYFSNKDAISRKLRLCNTEVTRIDRESSRKVTFQRLLPDDTTIVAFRKKRTELSSAVS